MRFRLQLLIFGWIIGAATGVRAQQPVALTDPSTSVRDRLANAQSDMKGVDFSRLEERLLTVPADKLSDTTASLLRKEFRENKRYVAMVWLERSETSVFRRDKPRIVRFLPLIGAAALGGISALIAATSPSLDGSDVVYRSLLGVGVGAALGYIPNIVDLRRSSDGPSTFDGPAVIAVYLKPTE